MSFRFETHENVIMRAKMHNITWEQAAQYGFHHQLDKSNVTIEKVSQNGDELVILKRVDKPFNRWYKWGWDQKNVYERTTINRRTKEVSVDTFNRNWWVDEPYVARRDVFQTSNNPEDSGLVSLYREFY